MLALPRTLLRGLQGLTWDVCIQGQNPAKAVPLACPTSLTLLSVSCCWLHSADRRRAADLLCSACHTRQGLVQLTTPSQEIGLTPASAATFLSVNTVAFGPASTPTVLLAQAISKSATCRLRRCPPDRLLWQTDPQFNGYAGAQAVSPEWSGYHQVSHCSCRQQPCKHSEVSPLLKQAMATTAYPSQWPCNAASSISQNH